LSQVRDRPTPSNRGRPAPPAGRGARPGGGPPLRPLRTLPRDGRAPTRGGRALRDGGPDTRRRGVALLLVLVLLTGVAGWRLVDLQVLSGPALAERGLDQRVRTVTLAAERGSIFDRNFVELAMSVPRHTIWADPRLIVDKPAAAAALAPVLGLTTDFVLARIDQPDRAFVYLARQVDDDIAAAVDALEIPGVGIVPESRRFYPGGAVAATVLGRAGLDNTGLEGLELQYEELLTGTQGTLTVERDPQGREIPQSQSTYEPPVRGDDIVTTIDQDLQYEVERLLAEQVDAYLGRGGIAVVMNVHTGEILAMATVVAPQVQPDPNDPDADQTAPVVRAPARPATTAERNQAVTDNYEPGSILKVVTMAAALEDGTWNWTRGVDVPGTVVRYDRTVRDAWPHGTQYWTMGDILRRSSNVGTIAIADSVGRESLDHWLRAFGLGQTTGVDFPGEAHGLMLDVDDWSGVTSVNVPIGQGIAATPLQMLSIYQTIANGGERVTPRLVSATIDGEGLYHPVEASDPERVIQGTTADALNMMLRGVVECDGGTAYGHAQVEGYTVAGKSGTAQVPAPGGYSEYQYRSSFVGFLPAEDPQLAAIVVLDSDKPNIGGGAIAGPVFADIMSYAIRDARVAPPTVDPIADRTGPVPSQELGPDCQPLGGQELGETREAPGQAPVPVETPSSTPTTTATDVVADTTTTAGEAG
jgi:cell division protein FtsI (penicillin-binding protein 3)